MGKPFDVEQAVKDVGSALDERLARYEARAARPAFFGGAPSDDGESPAARKAFETFVRTGDRSSLQSKSVNITTGADGAVAVVPTVDRVIRDTAIAASPLRGLATVVQTTNQEFSVLVSQGNAVGGWVGESDTRAETDSAKLAQVKPTFAGLYANVPVSNAALNDLCFDVAEWVARETGKTFGRLEDTAFLSGAGTAGPKGILVYTFADAPTFGQIKRITTGTSAALGADTATKVANLIKTVGALRAQYRTNARWLMSPAIIDSIRGLLGTDNRPIFTDAINGSPARLLGYEVVEDENMPTAAAGSKSILFGDFRAGYLVADVNGAAMVRDPYTKKGWTLFYTERRVGGALLDSAALVGVVFQ